MADIDLEKVSNVIDAPVDEEGLGGEGSAIDYLDAARSAFNSSDSYFRANIHKSFTSSLMQFHSQHADNSKYRTDTYRYKSKLFKPKSRAAVRKHEAAAAAAFFSTRDVVAIEAVDSDNQAQVDSAKFYNELMNLRLKTSIPWFQLLIGAYQDSMVYGTVVSKQTWNFEKNAPEISIVAPENFRFDPSCNWVDPIKSSPYLIELIPMYVFQVRDRIENDGWNDVSDKALMAARKQNYDPVRITREKDRLDPKDRPNSLSEHDIVWVHMNVINMGAGDVVYYTLGTEAMLTEPEDLDEVFFNGRPFVMGKCVIETHRNYPSSLMDLTRPIQQESNEILNQRLDNVKLALDTRIFMKRNQRVDPESIRRNAPGTITFLDNPKEDVVFARPNDVTSSSYQEVNYLNLDFDSLVGGFDGATVQANRSLNETVGGMNLLSSSANQVTEYQLKTFTESWVEPVLQQLLQLMQAYETDETVIGIAGKKSGMIQRYGNVDEMAAALMEQDLTMTVSVGMGAVNPATQVEKFMMALGSLAKVIPDLPNRLNFKEVAKEVFGKLGYSDGQRFVSQNLDDETDPEKEMMQQQIQQLQQQLANATKKPEYLLQAEAKLKEAQAIKTGVEAAFASMQAGEIVASMPAVAPLADGIMASAGYQAQAGDDPNFPRPVVSQDILAAAKEQADAHFQQRNNNPLTPKPPRSADAGSKSGIEGGSE